MMDIRPMSLAMSLTIAAALVFAGAAAVAQVPDISGTWVAEAPSPVGEIEVVYRFKESDGRLSGSQVLSVGESPIVEGELHGEEFSFTVAFTSFGAPRTLMGSGRIVADGLAIVPAIPPPPGGATPKPLVFHRGFPSGDIAVDPMDYRELPALRLPALKVVSRNALAQTPPMGWNSWNRFAVHVSDALVRDMADALVKSGMRAAGYRYVIIDDGWQGRRDAQGVLQPNAKFPDMKALARYVHARGLKLGLYSSPGPRSCAGYEGSYGHETLDVRTWASWGIDYLKYDWCSAGQVWKDADMRAVYQRMGEALRKVKRPILFSVCQYGRDDVQEWAPLVGAHLWRTTGDIKDNWERLSEIGFSQGAFARFAGPGHWNDPDMLEIGNGKMSIDEYRTQFSLWALLAAPLIAGNDVRELPAPIADILLNREVIGVDQDSLGRQGVRVSKNGDVEIWVRPLRKGAAVGIFNRGPAAAETSVTWGELGLASPRTLRDVWSHQNEAVGEGISTAVPSHGVMLFRVEP
jgi:alpha-galactosidase